MSEPTYADMLPGVIRPDHNREPVEEQTAEIDLNSVIGVAVDHNGTRAEDRGQNVDENEEAQALIDASEPADPDSDYIGDRLDADAINTPGSIYLSPPLDAVDPPLDDPPEVEQPLPDPEAIPPMDSGLLRSA